MSATAREKRAKAQTPTSEAKLAAMRRYIEEVDHFATLLRNTHEEIADLNRRLAIAKQQHDEARENVREAKEVEHNTVALLLKFIVPGSCEILPLFDQMEEPDEEKHGEHAADWRKESIAALKLSAAALRALMDADVVLVGQLQDRMLSNPDDWHEQLEMSVGMAEAIAAKLHEFIAERTT